MKKAIEEKCGKGEVTNTICIARLLEIVLTVWPLYRTTVLYRRPFVGYDNKGPIGGLCTRRVSKCHSRFVCSDENVHDGRTTQSLEL